MIRRKKGVAKKAFNRLVSRPAIHRMGVDTRALEGKVDLLLRAGKSSEADVVCGCPLFGKHDLRFSAGSSIGRVS